MTTKDYRIIRQYIQSDMLFTDTPGSADRYTAHNRHKLAIDPSYEVYFQALPRAVRRAFICDLADFVL